MATDVEAKLEAQIRQFRRDAEEAAKEEEAARNRRTNAMAQAAEYESALRIIRKEMGILAGPTNGTLPLLGDVRTGTIAEMCMAYMRQRGGEASVTELVAFLKERGKFTGTNQHGFYGTVFGTLRKHRAFCKVPGKTGSFALLESANNGVAASLLEPSGA